MKSLTLLFLLFITNCFGQEYMTPMLKRSFGIHHHTNRDVAFWSTADNESNVVITATTERDSTFNDIFIIKLDESLTELWQKRISLDTEVSYDFPVETFIDHDNNIYSIAKSYITLGSGGTGSAKTVITKLSSEGEELWNMDMGEVGYIDSFLGDSDELALIYLTHAENNNELIYHFITITPEGTIINDIQRSDITDFGNDDFSGLYTKAYYIDGDFYMIYQRHNYTANPGFYEHFIKKINASGMEIFPINSYMDIDDVNLFYQHQFQKDATGNMYITYPLEDVNKYYTLKINNTGGMVYSANSGGQRAFLKSFINNNNNLCVVNNHKTGGVWSLNMVEYGAEGNILVNTTIPGTPTDAVKIFGDGSILAYSNGVFKLFNASLSLITQFSTYYSQFTDINKIDDEHMIVLRNTGSPMYPASNQYANVDIHSDLINQSDVLASYSYSGEGTSMCGSEKLLVDNDDNYIVIAIEELGESNYDIGGSTAPTARFVYKYDTNLNLLWNRELSYTAISNGVEVKNCLVDSNNYIFINVPDLFAPKLIKISPDGNAVFDVSGVRADHIYFDQDNNINLVVQVENPGNADNTIVYTYSAENGSLLNTEVLEGVMYLAEWNDNSGNSYLYTYLITNEIRKIYIYKNLVLQSAVSLGISGSSAGIGIPVLGQQGTLYLETSLFSQYQLFRIEPNGISNSVSVPYPISQVGIFNSGKVAATTTNGTVNIYNADLTLVNSNILSSISNDPPYLLAVGNYMMFKKAYQDVVLVFDESGQLLLERKMLGISNSQYAWGSISGDLVVTGSFGSQLYTYEEYSWYRGLIHKFNLYDYIPLNTDQESFVYDKLHIYPNPSANFINIKDGIKSKLLKTEIYDITGKMLLASDKERFDISALPMGIYIAKIYTVGGIRSEKIIKQ